MRLLVQEEQQLGFHQVTWDGRDGHGRAVANGIYFYRLQTPHLLQTQRMLLLK